jgi:hypothetical protein
LQPRELPDLTIRPLHDPQEPVMALEKTAFLPPVAWGPAGAWEQKVTAVYLK